MTFFIILLALLLIFGGGGYAGYTRYGSWSFSPLVLVLVVFLLLWLTGTVHADPQGTYWQDPDTGLFSMVDAQSHTTVSGCSELVEETWKR